MLGGFLQAISPSSSIRFMMFLCRCRFVTEDFEDFDILILPSTARSSQHRKYSYTDQMPCEVEQHLLCLDSTEWVRNSTPKSEMELTRNFGFSFF